MRKIIFFQPTPSPHMSPLIAALAALHINIDCFFVNDLDSDRTLMGWSEGSYGNANTHKPAKLADLQNHILEHGVPEFIIISGHLYVAEVRKVLLWSASNKYRVIIISEGLNPFGIKGVIRKLRHSWIERTIKRHISAVLCMGQNGIDWHLGIGYKSSKLFPFCYVVDQAVLGTSKNCNSNSTIRFAFAGALIPRKSVDTLFYALSRLSTNNWQLVILGDGEEKTKLEKIACESGFSDKIIWRGMLSNFQLRQELTTIDCLILPSLFDGWGAVVNEALAAGCWVIASQWCGSKDLIIDGKNGFVFEAANVDMLSGYLAQIIEKQRLTDSQRFIIQSSAQNFSASLVAAYLLNIFDYITYANINEARPVAPWFKPQYLG